MRILLTGGGTGGHITPLLAVAHELKKKDPKADLLFIGEKRSKFSHLTEEATEFSEKVYIEAGKFRRYHGQSWLSRIFDVKTNLLNLRDAFLVLIGFFQSVGQLNRLKPDIIFAKGGFVCVPVGLAAAVLRIPYITHDSDTVPGLANRIIGRWAALHATGMPAELYAYPKHKTRYVGVPLSDKFQPATMSKVQQAKKSIGIPPESSLLLVTGGSQGSQRINRAVAAIADGLLGRNPSLYILHHVGRGNLDVYGDYRHKRLLVHEFISDFHHAAMASTVVVSRGGANSLAEFGILGKPVIVIPAPFLASGHQLKNARRLEEEQAIINLEESAVRQNPELLKQSIEGLLKHSNQASLLASKLQSLTKKDAAKETAKLILEQASKS